MLFEAAHCSKQNFRANIKIFPRFNMDIYNLLWKMTQKPVVKWMIWFINEQFDANLIVSSDKSYLLKSVRKQVPNLLLF